MWISCASAVSDLFADDVDTASPSSTLSLFSEDLSDEGLWNLSDESLWNADILTSCSNGDMEQPSKLRARDAVCPPGSLTPPSTEIEVPEMLNLLDVENAVRKVPKRTRKFNYKIGEDSVTSMTDESVIYCAQYAERSYILPVCGSGFLKDRVPKTPPYYSRIENSRIRECVYQSMVCL